MTELEVANVVGMITYQQELDMAALAETFEDREETTSVTYEPAENHWLQTRFAPDDTYVAFYRSGRCSIAGCESVEHFETVVEQVNGVMRDLLGFEYEPAVEVSNIVATADLGSNISLEALTIELGMERTEYEPEQFPALMYRDSEYVMLVFSSGKLLCTGLTDRQAVSEAIETMASRIRAVL
ncbi:transcription initiation factor TFIID TATA-box-binding protein [Halalkaliarchaeum desulfuricum]|uniref:Transcription initiation factor TFIID TATA-box-binding protein n=1 Tax=Halalkaliarchaeum desulfuricum TaxID=2055893 RepID=A0A343TLV5_9EURY|nr:transcription factor [Halalkaliarchaeum desulfuricum]AUX10077.1 transcription initiation factor TFIID TATA-box-binding protein [Halalkaliarchaeum desulfuricum]